MQGSKKQTIRRDERAEPEDEGSSPRIDVVNVDGPGTGSGGGSGLRSERTDPRSEARSDPRSEPRVTPEGASAGITALKAQLARLHEQAAAVERSLDDQRRDRSEEHDRLERAAERTTELEARVTELEAEACSLRKTHEDTLADLQTMLAERDTLAAALEIARTAAAGVGQLKRENEALQGTLDEAVRASTARETGLADLRKTEATKARDNATKIERELALSREEANKARESASKLEQELSVSREEARKAREQAAKAENAGGLARGEAAVARDQIAKLRQELAAAKEDILKNRETARERIDLVEKALEDARAAATRADAELEAARATVTALTSAHGAVQARAVQAEARATLASGALSTLEQNVRRLREDIAGGFAKIGHGAAPPPLPPAARSASREMPKIEEPARLVPQSIPPEMLDSVPPSPQSEAPVARAISESPALALELDNDWATPDETPQLSSVRPASSSPSQPPPSVPSPLPRSSTAYMAAARRLSSSPGPSSTPPAARSKPPSIPPPTYASVPPQLHDSGPPSYDSERPMARTSVRPSAGPRELRDSVVPATRRRDPSAYPGDVQNALGELTREALLGRLADPAQREEAALELKRHPDWQRSVPPMSLIDALQSVDYDSDRAVFDLARQWEREPLCHALIASLRAEPDARLREHAAWLLKHLAAPSSWKAIADLARSEEEGIQLRRWLLEALDRLAAGRAIGWRELGDVVTTVAKHRDASLRDGVVGILVSLDRSDEKRRLLLEVLRTDDDEVVLASAVNALAGALPMELDPGLVERLLGHPSPRVQRSVRDLIERARQTKG